MGHHDRQRSGSDKQSREFESKTSKRREEASEGSSASDSENKKETDQSSAKKSGELIILPWTLLSFLAKTDWDIDNGDMKKQSSLCWRVGNTMVFEVALSVVLYVGMLS